MANIESDLEIQDLTVSAAAAQTGTYLDSI